MIEAEDLSKRYGDKLAAPPSSDSREARLPAPVESFTTSTSTRHVRRPPIPAAWQARSSRTVRERAIVPAGLAPVLPTGAYLVTDILQRASYSPMRQTISVMAGQAGTGRWIMTGGILLVAGCHLVTAAGLTGARPSARGLLTVAGLAGIGIATSPEPASGPTPQHLARTALGAVTIAVSPACSAGSSSRPSGQPPGPGRAADVIGPDLVAVRRRSAPRQRPPRRRDLNSTS